MPAREKPSSPSSVLAGKPAGPGGALGSLRPRPGHRAQEPPLLWKLPGSRGPLQAPILPPAHQGPAQARHQLRNKSSRHDAGWASRLGVFPLWVLGLGCRRPGSEARAEGLGQVQLSPCLSLAEASSALPFPACPPICPAPPVGVQRGEVVDNLCINLSAWGLLVRWCLSGFRSCQMGLPEPVGEGGQQEPLLQGLEVASPSLGLYSPLPPHGLPSLPHQDTEHCMNSGLNGIISEFWSTASSGYFTNYLSLLCGGQRLGWGL